MTALSLIPAGGYPAFHRAATGDGVGTARASLPTIFDGNVVSRTTLNLADAFKLMIQPADGRGARMRRERTRLGCPRELKAHARRVSDRPVEALSPRPHPLQEPLNRGDVGRVLPLARNLVHEARRDAANLFHANAPRALRSVGRAVRNTVADAVPEPSELRCAGKRRDRCARSEPPVFRIKDRDRNGRPVSAGEVQGRAIASGCLDHKRKRLRANEASASNAEFLNAQNMQPSFAAWSLSVCANTLSASGKRHSP